ncbi:MAG: LysM peptidoglycan-binding domain-containing protein [Deltaproteobacteria bacterium]|nr:LysM peptidoglycan-binding domain-containing protein [Deltaproteobacteria bacterium]
MKRRLLALTTTALAALVGFPTRAALAADKKGAPAKTKAAPKAAEGDDANESGESGESGENNEAGEEAEAPAAGETKGQQVAAPQGEQPTFKNGVLKPPPEGTAMPTVNETHTVIKGDTLWDLSQHYLGNPWYWPKVWSYNPQIANPHWIYPGDKVKFSGAGGPSADAEEAPQEAQPVTEEDNSPADDDETPVSASSKIGYTAPKVSSFRQDGIITDRELEESGQLVRSTAEQEMLDNLDVVYARFKSSGDAKSGDRFFVFRTVREVNHPITGAHYGYVTRVVGVVTIHGQKDGLAEGVIDHTFDEIHRGDYLAPYSDKLSKQVAEKTASRPVEGVVVDSLADVPFMGEADLVFVDKGKRDGLEEGNVLAVTRQQDGVTAMMLKPGEAGYEDSRLPPREVGRLMVLDAKDGASTCLVLRSIREFLPGDKFTALTTSASTGPVSLR